MTRCFDVRNAPADLMAGSFDKRSAPDETMTHCSDVRNAPADLMAGALIYEVLRMD